MGLLRTWQKKSPSLPIGVRWKENPGHARYDRRIRYVGGFDSRNQRLVTLMRQGQALRSPDPTVYTFPGGKSVRRSRLDLALRRVRLIRHRLEDGKEFLRLAGKQVHLRQEGRCGSCASEFIGQRANDGTVGKFRAKKFARNREDEVGLEECTFCEEIRKGET